MIDFSQLDKTIHERGRLSIMTLLAARSEWSFQDLKAELEMSDGNLITHLRTLQEAGFISLSKNLAEPRPRTTCALTPAGRQAFHRYLDLLEEILRSTGRQAQGLGSATTPKK
ncbi:MAG: transcriptional regulator [Verrucomicrobiales bacterium]